MEKEVTKVKVKSKKNEDIKHRAYMFSIEVIKFIRAFKKHDLTTEVLFKQLLRSSTSIGANIVEGQASPSKKDFVNFYTIALKSANETKYWLCLTRDVFKIEIENLIEENIEISKILGAIIVKLKTK